MPLDPRSWKPRHVRHMVCAALLGAALLTLAAALCGASSAQRQRRQTRNSQPQSGTKKQPRQNPPRSRSRPHRKPAHIEFGNNGLVMIKNDDGTPVTGSSIRVEKDGNLTVVVPNAYMENPAPFGSGRGYTRIDVVSNRQSGPLSISFRPKPGARPYYDTKHGRVNVSYPEPAPPPKPRTPPRTSVAADDGR